MTTLSDRLRGVIRPAFGRGASSDAPGHVGSEDPTLREAVADVLDGRWHERDGQRFLVVDRTYVPGYRHGSMALADALPPSDGMWPALSLLAHSAPSHPRTVPPSPLRGFGVAGAPSHLLFIDLETTGIAGGAGTYAFLVGCGWFDGGVFRTRQYFLSSFTAERALLEDVAELAANAGAVVTYNGKTFDLPLIETRYSLHRLQTPFAGLPHVDMLHPARRMWREPESACRLITLEQTLCGYEREGDVAGFEIPARYFHYVHAGDARPLAAVFEHNRLDLVSLALVTARAAQLLDEGAAGARTAREALGMGRLYERGGMMPEAKSCFARATELEKDDEELIAEALRAYAVVSRRLRQYDDAAAAWRRLLGLPLCPQPIEREASEALAIHLEHRRRDLISARDFTVRLLRADESVTRRQATEYRLARLDRKLESRAEQPALRF
jgi:tetratricopeptide (TPR) repeat protein